MKKRFTLVLSLLVIGGMALDMKTRMVHGNSSGAPAGHTGSPSDGVSCAKSGCHTGGPSQSNQVAAITSNIPVDGYTPGTTYTMTATMSNGGSKFGFSVSPQDAQGNRVGTLISTPGATALNGSGGKYITHTFNSNSGSGTKSWNFEWTAPVAGTGDVTFYGAFNFANNNGSTGGDVIVTHSQVFTENINTTISEQALNAISIYPNPVEDVINIRLSDVDEVIMVHMFGMDGRVVVANTYNHGNILIDLASQKVPAGIYILQVATGDHQVIRKVVVQ